MDNEHGELALELETLPDTDSEEPGALIQRLRGELLALGGLVAQFILQPEVLSGRRAVLAPASPGTNAEALSGVLGDPDIGRGQWIRR